MSYGVLTDRRSGERIGMMALRVGRWSSALRSGLPVPSPDGTMLAWTSSRSGGAAGQLFLAQWNHAKALEAVKAAPLRKPVRRS